MCGDCSPSSEEADEWPEKLAFFPWMKQIGVIKDDCDDDHDCDSFKVVKEQEDEEDENSKCSCCGVGLSNRRFYPPCILIKPSSWGVLDYAKNKGIDDDHDDDDDDQTFEADHSDHSRSDFAVDRRGDEQGTEENREIPMVSGSVESVDAVEGEEDGQIVEKVLQEERIQEGSFGVSTENDQACEQSKVEENGSGGTSSETPLQHLEFYIGQEDCTLIPIDLVESTEAEGEMRKEQKAEENGSSGNEDVILDFDMEMEAQVELVTETWHSWGDTLELVSLNTGADVTKPEAVESAELSESTSAVVFRVDGGELETKEFPPLSVSHGTQTVSDDENGDYDDGKAVERQESDLDVQQGTFVVALVLVLFLLILWFRSVSFDKFESICRF